MPSSPTKRPMRCPLSVASGSLLPKSLLRKPRCITKLHESSSQDTANERALFARGGFADRVAGGDQGAGFGQPGVAIVMNCCQRFVFFDGIADTLVEFEADGVVDLVFFFFAAAAEDGEGDSELFAVGAGDEARSGAGNNGAHASAGEELGLVDYALVTALEADALAEFFAGLAGGDHGFGEAAAFVEIAGALAEKN